MEYLQVKELLNELAKSDISYLSEKDLNSLYKTLEKSLKSIEFLKLQGKILSDIENFHSNLYLVQLAKQNKISISKSPKITIKNIETIQKKLEQIQELEQTELPKHKKILENLKNLNETEFLQNIQEISKNDLELVSYLANITDSDGKLIKLGKTKTAHKNNLQWFEYKNKEYATGLGLLKE